MRSSAVFVSCCLLSALPFVAMAQTVSPPAIPDPATPGRLLPDRTPLPAPQARPRPAAPAPVTPPLPTPEASTFAVRKVVFTGATRIPLEPLQQAAAILTRQPVTEAVVATLADQLTAQVRATGYLLSAVTLPPQDITTGTVHFVVVEQGIRTVQFAGDPRLTDNRWITRWRATLLADVPLRRMTLERVLMTLNGLPGVKAESTLFADPDSGGVSLRIVLTQKRLQGLASLDNRGSHYVGPWQAALAGSANGLATPFDRLSVRALSGTDNQELQGIDSSYQTLLNAGGSTLKLGMLRVWSEPGYTLTPARLENISTRSVVALEQPLIRERSRNLVLETAFTVQNTTGKTFGTLLSRDRTRAVSLGGTFDIADSLGGVTLLNGVFTQGLNVFGASKSGDPLLSRSNGKSDFGKFEAYLVRTQSLGGPISLQAALQGQYALSQLLSSEEFGYGGAQFGRGYDPSALVGDHGIAGLLEVRYDLTPGQRTWLRGVQLYSSYDFGMVWAIDTDTRFNRQAGASAAIGTRFSLARNLGVELQVAKPLTRGNDAFAADSSDRPRAFLGLNARF